MKVSKLIEELSKHKDLDVIISVMPNDSEDEGKRYFCNPDDYFEVLNHGHEIVIVIDGKSNTKI